jgi:hypothetical protein
MRNQCGGAARLGGVAAVSAALAAAFTISSAPARAQQQSLLGAGLPRASLGGPCLGPRQAYLRARIRGALRLDVDLHGTALACQGGPRSDGSGIRMGFEGRVAPAGRMRMIFGIDGARKGHAGRELPTNLTVIFEDRKLLFATQGAGNCTVDRLTQEPLGTGHTRPARAAAKAHAQSETSTAHPAASRRARGYRVVAHGFCIAPANDLSGRRRILVTTFDFAGRADFKAP